MKIRHYLHYHHKVLYETTLVRHLISIVVTISMLTSIFALLLHFSHTHNSFDINSISLADVMQGSVNTLYRMSLAFILSLLVALPIALFINSSTLIKRIFLPIADILQSIPVLAFFPVLVTFFIANNALELAAIFVIFLSMIWNIVFPVIGGLQTIPNDVNDAAFIMNVFGVRKFWYITVPAIFPFVVTGSMLAWAQGWTIVIVAEVLHTYIPNGNMSQDLLGLGSLLVDSNAQGQRGVFFATLTAMIILVTILNIVVWQPLLHLSQRYRFD